MCQAGQPDRMSAQLSPGEWRVVPVKGGAVKGVVLRTRHGKGNVGGFCIARAFSAFGLSGKCDR